MPLQLRDSYGKKTEHRDAITETMSVFPFGPCVDLQTTLKKRIRLVDVYVGTSAEVVPIASTHRLPRE